MFSRLLPLTCYSHILIHCQSSQTSLSWNPTSSLLSFQLIAPYSFHSLLFIEQFLLSFFLLFASHQITCLIHLQPSNAYITETQSLLHVYCSYLDKHILTLPNTFRYNIKFILLFQGPSTDSSEVRISRLLVFLSFTNLLLTCLIASQLRSPRVASYIAYC